MSYADRRKPLERLPNGDYLIRTPYDYVVATPDFLRELGDAIQEELEEENS